MNIGKLLGLLKENGDTQETLAKALGMSRGCLSAKIHGRNNASFTQPEILAIKKRYNLNGEQVNMIFFNENVS